MKNAVVVLAKMALILLFAGIPALGEPHIIHYEATGKLDTKRPDFKGAVIAIDFGGPEALNALKKFRKLGAQDFSDDINNRPCTIDPPVICIGFNVSKPASVSTSSTSYGYSNTGSASNQSSFNGQQYSINVTLTLIRRGNNGRIENIPLGVSSTLAPAGMSYESIAGYGRNGGSATSFSTTSGLDATIGNAISQGLIGLLEPWKGWGIAKHLITAKIVSPWVPGADVEVEKAFEAQQQ
jgi:hypothetical protein